MILSVRRTCIAAALAFFCSAAFGSSVRAADTYVVDPVHSSISFMIEHQGISKIHGRFNDFSGKFTIDRDDPSKSSFALSVKVESVDTNNAKRDEHLRAPDYFNVKQFPEMTFQSTKVRPIDGGYEVTGDLSLHGVTKSITLVLKGGGKEVEFPKGMHRIGVETSPTINRVDFGMRSEEPGLGDEVYITMGIEAAKN